MFFADVRMDHHSRELKLIHLVKNHISAPLLRSKLRKETRNVKTSLRQCININYKNYNGLGFIYLLQKAGRRISQITQNKNFTSIFSNTQRKILRKIGACNFGSILENYIIYFSPHPYLKSPKILKFSDKEFCSFMKMDSFSIRFIITLSVLACDNMSL